MGWIYLRSLVLKEHRQSDANNTQIHKYVHKHMNTQKHMCTNTQNEMQTYKHGSSVQVGSRDISKHEAANDATDGDKF